jgi:putative transposase
MEPSKAVKEYKEELVKSQKQNERLTALVGEVTVEKEWCFYFVITQVLILS